MRLSEYATYDAVGLAALIASKQVTVKEVSNLAVAAINGVNEQLNAVIEVFSDRVDGPSCATGKDGLLYGVPMLNKDLAFTEAGRLHEMGSRFTRGYMPSSDSPVVERLHEAGLNILGRTTTPEFGGASITESVLTGVTRNPWDVDRTPAGSSGGSAAIVAAGAVPTATAGDGGGSTRSPAGYCGLVGLKPSRGRVPVGPGRGNKHYELSASLPVCRSVRDCAVLLDVLGDPLSADSYDIKNETGAYAEVVKQAMAQLRVAFTDQNWAGVPTDKASCAALRVALTSLAAEGHVLEETSPSIDWPTFFDATVVIMCANMANSIDHLSGVLGRQAGCDDLQASTWACYRQGKSYTAADIAVALETFDSVDRAVGAFFEYYDVLVTPTNVHPAPLLSDCYSCDPREPVTGTAYQTDVYANDLFLCLFNTTGQPAITLPLYQTNDGLPVGVQFVSRLGNEKTLLQIGSFFEAVCPWAWRVPSVHASHIER